MQTTQGQRTGLRPLTSATTAAITAAITAASAWALAACGGHDGPDAGLAAAHLPVADTRVQSAARQAATPASGATPALPAHCLVVGKRGAHKGIDNQDT